EEICEVLEERNAARLDRHVVIAVRATQKAVLLAGFAQLASEAARLARGNHNVQAAVHEQHGRLDRMYTPERRHLPQGLGAPTQSLLPYVRVEQAARLLRKREQIR